MFLYVLKLTNLAQILKYVYNKVSELFFEHILIFEQNLSLPNLDKWLKLVGRLESTQNPKSSRLDYNYATQLDLADSTANTTPNVWFHEKFEFKLLTVL